MALRSFPSYYMNTRIKKSALALLIGGGLGIIFFAYIFFSERGRFPSLIQHLRGFMLSFLIGSIVAITLYFWNLWLDRLIRWNNLFATRLIVGFISSTIIGFALIIGPASIQSEIASNSTFWSELSLKDEDLMTKILILLLTFIFVYQILYAVLYSYLHYTVAQIESVQNERKQLELQFEALKSQVSPHYLFNSLNTISSLLFKDLPSAEQFIRRLAQTYQYILETQHKRFVLLEDEIEFVKSYYYLLRIRFQQQLDVEINVPGNILNSKIPPLTLQMLVENAVKHNDMMGEKKLFIYITAQDNTYLKVINTKTSSADNVQSFKVGLENIRKRYRFFTQDQILVKDDDKFTVQLPVIPHVSEVKSQKYSA